MSLGTTKKQPEHIVEWIITVLILYDSRLLAYFESIHIIILPCGWPCPHDSDYDSGETQ